MKDRHLKGFLLLIFIKNAVFCNCGALNFYFRYITREMSAEKYKFMFLWTIVRLISLYIVQKGF